MDEDPAWLPTMVVVELATSQRVLSFFYGNGACDITYVGRRHMALRRAANNAGPSRLPRRFDARDAMLPTLKGFEFNTLTTCSHHGDCRTGAATLE